MDPGMLPACRECRKQQTVGIAARKGMDMIRIVPIQEYFDSNCYFYIDDISRCGFLIDPGAEPEKLLDLVRREEWRIEKILITHGHIDHIGAVNAVLREIPVPVYAHRMAEYFMQDEELNLSSVFGPPIHIEGLRYLEDGDEICLDSDPSFSLKVIYAPGHTVDSIVLYSEKDRAAFVGDTRLDVAAARANGIPVYGAGFGYVKPRERMLFDAVADTPGALCALLLGE